MSEATYTAWDDNLYEWPPPDGWYQADDGKWWPEGYGPANENSPDSDAEGPNEALLFEVERTSIFPAGGSGLVGTNQSEDRIEAESQRPVYDELPSIDDVFGGADPYATDDEPETPSSNGAVPFSGPPPSIDDLPGLGDLLDDENDDAPHEDALEDAEGLDGAGLDTELGDDREVDADLPDDEVVEDLIDDEIDDEAGGDDVDDASNDVDADLEDGSSLSVVDADDGDPVEADRSDTFGLQAEETVVSAIPAIPEIPDEEDLEDYFEDESDDRDHLGGESNIAADTELNEDVGTRIDRSRLENMTINDGDFDDIVENFNADETEAVDVGDDADEADFEAETKVSGMYLGELPDDGASPNRAAKPPSDLGPPLIAADANDDLEDDLVPEPSAEADHESDSVDADLDVSDRQDDANAYGDSPAIANAMAGDAGSEAARYRDQQGSDPTESSRGFWPLLALAAVAVIAAGAVLFVLLGRDSEAAGTDINSLLAETGPGSLSEPYSSGTGVVVFYSDNGSDEQQRWVIQVVDTVADQTDELVADSGAVAPGAESILAVTRVRVTYQSGPTPGNGSDLILKSIGSSLDFFDNGDSCSTGEELDLSADLEPGQAIEGDLCWEIPADDLADLKLSVEATPVNGVVFMNLG